MKWQWTSTESLLAIKEAEFSTLSPASDDSTISTTSPFLHREFLLALEQTNCVGGNSGWDPQHLIIRDNHNKLVAFLPAYIKHHSYGEYVFDHSWAQAYQQHGLAYYPKLIIAIPFTPVTSPRILVAQGISTQQIADYLASIETELFEKLAISSVHMLFAEAALSKTLALHNWHQRQSVQFNWYNQGYNSMDDFMSSLTARRRRSIRKERTGISKQGVRVKKVVGAAITSADMQFFYTCYKQTYLKRSGHGGYLNAEFFHQLLAKMAQHLLLVVAEKCTDDIQHAPIAAALFLHDENGLYGRYWGALDEVSGLHFEACYYQGIEFCIEHNIPLFNPGTQGEHKILRGFAPTICYSNHKMALPAFDNAVKDFLLRETSHIIDYAKQSSSLLPYKHETTTN